MNRLVPLLSLWLLLAPCACNQPTKDDAAAGETAKTEKATSEPGGPSKVDAAAAPNVVEPGEGDPEEAEAEPPDTAPEEAPILGDEGVEGAGDGTAIDPSAVADSIAAIDGVLEGERYDLFWGSKEDPPAEELHGITPEFEGRHYVYGDEYNLQLFYPKVKDLGGAYVGVGADQAYITIAWQKPEFAWLIDYDEWVVSIHAAYRLFFTLAKTADEFRGFWDKDNEDATLALLDKELADHPKLQLIKKLYKANRGGLRYRMTRLQKTFEAAKVPYVFYDQEAYEVVRNLVLQKRIRPLLANLLDDEGMVGIGAAAEALNVPIRVLYVSNAEEYWNYEDQYRANINALFFDEKSILMRTLSTWKRNKDYQYAVQGAQNYAGWLTRKWVERVSYIVQRQAVSSPDETPFIETTLDIETAEANRAARKERKKKGK